MLSFAKALLIHYFVTTNLSNVCTRHLFQLLLCIYCIPSVLQLPLMPRDRHFHRKCVLRTCTARRAMSMSFATLHPHLTAKCIRCSEMVQHYETGMSTHNSRRAVTVLWMEQFNLKGIPKHCVHGTLFETPENFQLDNISLYCMLIITSIYWKSSQE